MTHAARTSGLRRLTAPLALLCVLTGASGCSLIGYSMGRDADLASAGTEVALGQAAEIEPGTPLAVGLADGGVVRGVDLGVVTLPVSANAPERRAIRLGVGNAALIERLFSRHTALASPTTADVPDTLVFPLDSVRSLHVPAAGHAAATGAAVGAGIDAATVVTVAALALVAALAMFGL